MQGALKTKGRRCKEAD